MGDYTELFNKLQQQIDKAEKNGQSIKTLVMQQIKILELSHDEFVKTAKKKGYADNDFRVAHIEVQQYSAMKQLSQKIGLPTDKYDKCIKDIQIKILGEENYKNFSGE